jgi:nucleotide-binding universal stress UspA family protein
MKVLATFDGSACAESILPQLRWLARLPGVEFLLFSAVAPIPSNASGLSAEQRLARSADYLRGIARSIVVGPRYTIDATIADDAASAIIERAMKTRPDIIVMATHGHTARVHLMFGDVAEQVVRAGVAPVLLVQPEAIKPGKRAATEVATGEVA